MLTQAFLPLLKKASCDPNEKSLLKALVLNMSSLTGSIGDNGSGKKYPYRASKAALNVINKSLSVDLKPFGIMAVVLDPGWVKTDMGGKNALISTEESVSGMMKVIGSLDESKSGMWFNYRGNVVPW
jgi:NAD(P)-dependent dehydrogenase (short-subunit alcohol dehydrogenase family)